jgi:ribosomal protein L11 methyltransferase
MNYLEVKLTLNGELAEAVADVLARFAPNGVVTEQNVEFTNDEDEGTPSGDVTVRAFLDADDPQIDETRRKVEEALHYLNMIQPIPNPIFTPIADQNWMEAWKARYQPIPIGSRLIILPAWMESPAPDRLPIKIDPGMAFGTGTHPTTQLCLEFLEETFQPSNLQLSTVIDVGCGSGILSIGAIKLGAALALGVDIDEAAIRNSRENADNNAVPAEKFLLGVGSVDEVRGGKFALTSAPLVLANILAPVLIRLFDAGLADLVDPNGALILSGILDHQSDSVIESAQQHGMKFIAKKQIADWVALLVKK